MVKYFFATGTNISHGLRAYDLSFNGFGEEDRGPTRPSTFLRTSFRGSKSNSDMSPSLPSFPRLSSERKLRCVEEPGLTSGGRM